MSRKKGAELQAGVHPLGTELVQTIPHWPGGPMLGWCRDSVSKGCEGPVHWL